MKKTLALLLVILALVFLTAPIVIASTVADPVQAPVVEIAADEPVIEEGTPVPTETDPGGAPISLTELFQAVWSVLALVIIRYVIPWFRAKIGAEKLAAFDYWSTIAVAAAEKAYGAGKGAQKLAYAEEILKSKGFTIDTAVVDALIKQLFDRDITYDANIEL